MALAGSDIGPSSRILGLPQHPKRVVLARRLDDPRTSMSCPNTSHQCPLRGVAISSAPSPRWSEGGLTIIVNPGCRVRGGSGQFNHAGVRGGQNMT